MTNQVFVDTEYTNFNPAKGDMIQVGIVAVKDGIILDTIIQNIQPYRIGGWTKEAEKVHGITLEQSLLFPTKEEAVKNILEFMRKFDFVMQPFGYNIRGDEAYLDGMLGHHADWNSRLRLQWVDVLKLAKERKHLLPKSLTLSSVCNHFNIPINAHNALEDAIATFKVYECLKHIKTNDVVQINMKEDKTAIELRKKFLDRKYIQIGERGDIYISEQCTQNKEALRVAIDEIIDLFDVYG